VNLALLKAELLHARHQRHGLPRRARLISHVDALGRLGCLMPRLANAALQWRWVRGLLKRALGLTDRRPLPPFARQRFDHWFARRRRSRPGPRGRVILWDDTFARYHEPHIGQAAVAVLEAAGFEVVLPVGRQCCGRPAFSQGNLNLVQRLGRHNLKLLSSPPDLGQRTSDFSSVPVLFLEPSCWTMFVEDYRELKLPGAEQLAPRCWLFEQFMEDLLRREPGALRFREQPGHVAIHAHCHAKALLHPGFMARLAQRLPGRTAAVLDTACCGMAGAFGASEEKVELSLQVGRLLLEPLRQQPAGSVIVASGTSCRQQIEHLTARRPLHLAEVLAGALAEPSATGR
jgi:Fe-S oxidoreductase